MRSYDVRARPLLALVLVASWLGCGGGPVSPPSATSISAPSGHDAGPETVPLAGDGSTEPDAGGGGTATDAATPLSDGSSGGEPTVDASAEETDGGDVNADAALPRGTVDFVPGVTVSVLAGSDVGGEVDGTGAAAEFSNPTGVAIDRSGNLVVTDYDGATIRYVTPAGVVTTIAAASDFVGPFDVVVSADGRYYIGTDFDTAGSKSATSGTIWSVTPLSDGRIAAPVVVAQGLGRPRGLAPTAGAGLWVTDRWLSIVQQFDAASGTASFVAGSPGVAGFRDGAGSAAQFSSPLGAATLPDGDVLVADTGNNRIRRVASDGSVTTFAGNGIASINDGPRLAAEFSSPRDVAVDAAGNVYVSDAGNHCIRRIRVDGNVDTVAGSGANGFRDGQGPVAEFYGQEGIDVTPDGKTVYVADGNGGDGSAYHRIRAISIP